MNKWKRFYKHMIDRENKHLLEIMQLKNKIEKLEIQLMLKCSYEELEKSIEDRFQEVI